LKITRTREVGERRKEVEGEEEGYRVEEGEL
jgi:hypothetical protein